MLQFVKPLDPKYLEDEDFKANYDKLFQDSHLEFIHSAVYGAKGVQDSPLKTQTLHKAIAHILGCDEVNLYKDGSPVLLRFLLIIHLCPDQDNGFKANKANKAKHQNKDSYRQVLEREREEMGSGGKLRPEKKRGLEDNNDDAEDALVRDDSNFEKIKDAPKRKFGKLLQVTSNKASNTSNTNGYKKLF
ncbi:hypothetical protein INT46_009813 [Mucor plumbeus]|uniref:Uncharacterized protein n=1 Tax=Mucor plumbeus TaxID=97098 RepID=A0A8H7UNV7_9FUNG|nr:hypothetical protein INT46_009813 [Mucor plumbeus]